MKQRCRILAYGNGLHVKHGQDAGIECKPAELVVIAPLASGVRRTLKMYRAAIDFIGSSNLWAARTPTNARLLRLIQQHWFVNTKGSNRVG